MRVEVVVDDDACCRKASYRASRIARIPRQWSGWWWLIQIIFNVFSAFRHSSRPKYRRMAPKHPSPQSSKIDDFDAPPSSSSRKRIADAARYLDGSAHPVPKKIVSGPPNALRGAARPFFGCAGYLPNDAGNKFSSSSSSSSSYTSPPLPKIWRFAFLAFSLNVSNRSKFSNTSRKASLGNFGSPVRSFSISSPRVIACRFFSPTVFRLE